MMTIGEKIRRERLRKSLTIEGLAMLCDLATNTVYKIERSKIKQPRATTIQRICDALNIKMEVIL